MGPFLGPLVGFRCNGTENGSAFGARFWGHVFGELCTFPGGPGLVVLAALVAGWGLALGLAKGTGTAELSVSTGCGEDLGRFSTPNQGSRPGAICVLGRARARASGTTDVGDFSNQDQG